MAKVLIVYYSRSGNTEKMAELVAKGVRQSNAETIVKSAENTNVDDFLEADGVILGSPTYYGTMAAEIKRLLDDSVKFHGKLAGKIGGAFSSAANIGGGNETTIMDMLKALLIHGMIIPGNASGDHYGPVAIGAPDKRAATQCEKMGRIIGDLTVQLHG
ncbi:flavodoxin family protein [Verrucomicrobiota bacterium]